VKLKDQLQRWEDHADRMGEDRWPMIVWNYECTDERDAGERISRPVQALSCLICKQNERKVLSLLMMF
jgi:hypothetical protein